MTLLPDILTLKRHGRWRSDAIAERYVTESVHHQVSVTKKICYGTNNLETAAAAAVVATLRTIIRNKNNTEEVKIGVYESALKSIAVYGAELWGGVRYE